MIDLDREDDLMIDKENGTLIEVILKVIIDKLMEEVSKFSHKCSRISKAKLSVWKK